jgi:hypothetical protein
MYIWKLDLPPVFQCMSGTQWKELASMLINMILKEFRFLASYHKRSPGYGH